MNALLILDDLGNVTSLNDLDLWISLSPLLQMTPTDTNHDQRWRNSWQLNVRELWLPVSGLNMLCYWNGLINLIRITCLTHVYEFALKQGHDKWSEFMKDTIETPGLIKNPDKLSGRKHLISMLTSLNDY